jgi:hypothetical protein
MLLVFEVEMRGVRGGAFGQSSSIGDAGYVNYKLETMRTDELVENDERRFLDL